MRDITISMPGGLPAAFRAIPRAKRGEYQSRFGVLLVEGAEYENFVEEVTAEITTHSRASTLTADQLMTIIDEAYMDLRDHQAADEAKEEDGETVPWSVVKNELGL